MAWIADLIDILQKDGATDEFLENTRLNYLMIRSIVLLPKGQQLLY